MKLYTLENDPKGPDRSKVDKATSDKAKAEQDETAALCDLQLQATEYNRARDQFYTQDQADLFNRMEDMEADRIDSVKSFLGAYASCINAVHPLLARCLQNMDEATQTVDPVRDRAASLSAWIPLCQRAGPCGPLPVVRRPPTQPATVSHRSTTTTCSPTPR